jgi:hypothetical protein
VREEVKGAYLQFDAKGELGGLRYALNAGVRYVHTDQTSSGLSSGTAVTRHSPSGLPLDFKIA